MATNFLFDQLYNTEEQEFLDSLIIECIQIYGHDVYYMPRTINNKDKLYGADDISSFDHAYPIEMYIRSIEGFSGDGNFLSKFGFEIRDKVIFTVAKTTFEYEVGRYRKMIRPNEGDLIFFPLNNKCFQISFVDNKPFFYQLGKLQTYDLHCELFEYAGEKFTTGVPAIDRIAGASLNVLDYTLQTEDGNYLLTEDGKYIVTENFIMSNIDVLADNDIIQQISNTYVDFSELDPFNEDKKY